MIHLVIDNNTLFLDTSLLQTMITSWLYCCPSDNRVYQVQQVSFPLFIYNGNDKGQETQKWRSREGVQRTANKTYRSHRVCQELTRQAFQLNKHPNNLNDYLGTSQSKVSWQILCLRIHVEVILFDRVKQTHTRVSWIKITGKKIIKKQGS